MKKLMIATTLLATTLLAGCIEESDRKRSEATEQMMSEATTQVGMPGIKNWRELRMMRMLYELRDTEVTTFTYVKDMGGSLSFLCSSVGYGLPYATQFTNPQRYHLNGATLPQPEPNGLFMPDSAEATWVMCVDPSDMAPKPVYVEERLIISPFALVAERSYLGLPIPAPAPAKAP